MWRRRERSSAPVTTQTHCCMCQRWAGAMECASTSAVACCTCCLVVTLLKCLHSTLSVTAGCCYIHLVKLSLLIACLCLPCNECTVLLSDVVSSPDTMQAMDLYDVAEGYPSTVDALRRIKCPVLVNISLPCNYLSLWYACGTVHRCVRQCVSPV